MAILEGLTEALCNAPDTVEQCAILTRLLRNETTFSDIIETIVSAPLSETEKTPLYRHLAAKWMERHKTVKTTGVNRKHIVEYIQLSLLLDDEEMLSFAAQLTKAAGKISRAKLFSEWRKCLAVVDDYSKLIRYVCLVDEIAVLDDAATRELFTSYSYSVDDKEWSKLLTLELRLKHYMLLERLFSVAGSAERFVQLAGLPWEEIVAQLESAEDVSEIYMVAAFMLAAELRIAFSGEGLNYSQQVERFSGRHDMLAVNMTAYYAYSEFLHRGSISNETAELLKPLVPRYDTELHRNLIRLNIRCVEKCLDEGLDIRTFLEQTEPVNVFAQDSHIRSITWEETLDVSNDGFGTEKSSAQAEMDALFDIISDRKLLVYVFLNTHYGLFCDMIEFVFRLSESGEDIRALFSEYPLTSHVYDVEPLTRMIVIKILRHNCANITVMSPSFKGTIARHDYVKVRIVGTGLRRSGKKFIKCELASVQTEYDEEALLSCIDGLMEALPEEPFEIKQKLWLVPNGWSYRYNAIFACIFSFSKTFRLITACTKLVSCLAEKFDVETVLEIYMNTFLRTSMPFEQMCGILCEAHSLGAEELDLLLSQYTFSGIIRTDFTDNSKIFTPCAMLVAKHGLPLGSPMEKNGLAMIHASLDGERLILSAEPADEAEKGDSPKFVHKYTQLKLKSCSNDINTALTRPDIIAQAAEHFFPDFIYTDLVKGLYLRLTKCTFKNNKAIIRLLKYFDAVNPFADRDLFEYSRPEENKKRKIWQNIRPYLEDQFTQQEIFSAFFACGLSYQDMCFVYLNSPLRYEISIFDFLRECIEGFITENTAASELRLTGRRNSDNSVSILDICGEDGAPAVMTNCTDLPQHEWFTFLPEYHLDGTISIIDAQKYTHDEVSLSIIKTEEAHIIPAKQLEELFTRYFTDPSVRYSTDLYTIVDNLKPRNRTYIGDALGEFRVFARMDRLSGSRGIVPLNVGVNKTHSFEAIEGFFASTSHVYAFVPVFYFLDKRMMFMPVAKYEDDPDVVWENCLTESDVPLTPTRVCIGKRPYKEKTVEHTKQFLDTNCNLEAQELVRAAQKCRLSLALNISSLMSRYTEREINSALDGLRLTYFSRPKKFVNFKFDHSALVFCLPCEGGFEEVRLSLKMQTDAVLIMRFLKYENELYYFTLERAYQFDYDVAWHHIMSLEDIPANAQELDDPFSDKYDIIDRSEELPQTEETEVTET